MIFLLFIIFVIRVATGVFALATVAAAIVLRLGVAQYNVFLTVVKEVADDL